MHASPSTLLFLILSLLAPPALAALGAIRVESGTAFPRTKLEAEAPFSEHEPVLLSASRVDYDQEKNLVVASGQVEIVQGETVVLADRITYDQPTNRVTAQGNVSMMEPSGHVYFADALELRDDLKAGVIRHFKARMSDNSLLVAGGARKIDEERLELFKAAYTPCKCDPGGEPEWQIKAAHVLVDQEAQRVRYRDARMEAYGLPVFYTPVLSHATPGADNHSGFLMPEYWHSDNLGSVVKVPYYYAIAADRDTTIIPIYTTNEGPVLAGEYRQRFDSGLLMMDGSITRPKDRDATGGLSSGKQTRGHVDADGKFVLNEDYGWGFSIRRASDDTYLRRYNFSHDTLLTSRVYAEAFHFAGDPDRAYGSIEGLSFQGLTADTDSRRVPVVAPLAGFTVQSDPGWRNSRFSFDGNMMTLYRKLGNDSQRMSATAGWKLPYITDDGQMIEFTAQLRGDLYAVRDVPLSGGGEFDGTTGRLVPQVGMLWRWPFIARAETSSLILEPVASLAVSPYGSNPDEIPNEDSLVPEFTDTNLFSFNRYPGLDRIESGPRLAYGLRGQAQLFSDKYIHWLIGQNYRIDNDPAFPYSNDLDSRFSDYVGKLGVNYAPFSLAYRFRLDKDTLAAQRNEVSAGFYRDPVKASVTYLSLKNDPILASKEHIRSSLSLRMTRKWTWTTSGTADLELNEFTYAATGLIYRSECTEIVSQLGREFTHDRDIKPSTNFLFRVSLKNLE